MSKDATRMARAAKRKVISSIADETDRFVYLTVTASGGGSCSVDYHGTPVPIPASRCYGCNGSLPGVGEKVAVHVNNVELVITGRHL